MKYLFIILVSTSCTTLPVMEDGESFDIEYEIYCVEQINNGLKCDDKKDWEGPK